FPAISVKDHLWLGSRDRRRPTDDELGYVFDVFPGLAGRRNQKAGTLSGGEQQMLTVAMSLLANPKVLMIDEMSTGLAPIVVTRLLEAVRAIARDRKVAVVLVEQFVAQALEVADRATVLAHGRVALTAKAAELASDMDRVSAAYFAATVPSARPGGK